MPKSTTARKRAERKTNIGERAFVYALPSVPVEWDAKITRETRRQADLLFDDYLEPLLRGYKREEKRKAFHYVVHAAKQAHCLQGTVRYSRRYFEPGNSKMKMQVIESTVRAGLFEETRSPKGSLSMSRLLPSDSLTSGFSLDPWEFEAANADRLVRLVSRDDEKKELPFDEDCRTVREYRKKLERINQINGKFEITVRRYDYLEKHSLKPTRIRPVHYAVFTESLDLHGRLYTGRFGHQSLRKSEREWIRFDGEESVELDYKSFHARMLYHRKGYECHSDPYHLWGDETSKQQRMIVKLLVNALINASTARIAIQSCNHAMSQFVSPGKKKRGKDLEDARDLYDAIQHTKLSFKGLLPLVMERHYRIADCFGQDMGIQLMKTDSHIALNVMHHFAKKGTPILGVHDSFIVPKHVEAELKEVMIRCYQNEVGDYLPIIE